MANGPELLLKPTHGLIEERRGSLRESAASLCNSVTVPQERILRAQVAPGSLGRYHES